MFYLLNKHDTSFLGFFLFWSLPSNDQAINFNWIRWIFFPNCRSMSSLFSFSLCVTNFFFIWTKKERKKITNAYERANERKKQRKYHRLLQVERAYRHKGSVRWWDSSHFFKLTTGAGDTTGYCSGQCFMALFFLQSTISTLSSSFFSLFLLEHPLTMSNIRLNRWSQ